MKKLVGKAAQVDGGNPARLLGAQLFDLLRQKPLLVLNYQYKIIPRAEAVKNLNRRYKWDLFWEVNRLTGGHEWRSWGSLDDSHLETLLDQLVADIEEVQEEDPEVRREQLRVALANTVSAVVTQTDDGIKVTFHKSQEDALAAAPDHTIGRPAITRHRQEDRRVTDTWIDPEDGRSVSIVHYPHRVKQESAQ